MQTFVYNPSAQRETLKDFNARVSEFCLDNAVTRIESFLIGSSIVLKLTLADDLELVAQSQGIAGMMGEEIATFMPVVREIDPESLSLEEDIDRLVMNLAEKSTDEDLRLPTDYHLHHTVGKKRAWIVIIAANGSVEPNEDAFSEDGIEVKEPDEITPPSDDAGFGVGR